MVMVFLVVLVARLVGMYTPTFRWSHELGREPDGGPGRLGPPESGEPPGAGAQGD